MDTETMRERKMKAGSTDCSVLSHEEKNRQLFFRQKKTLDLFLERGAISQAQHDKSLHDLIEKMGVSVEDGIKVRQCNREN